jgi:hypothetical protein
LWLGTTEPGKVRDGKQVRGYLCGPSLVKYAAALFAGDRSGRLPHGWGFWLGQELILDSCHSGSKLVVPFLRRMASEAFFFWIGPTSFTYRN